MYCQFRGNAIILCYETLLTWLSLWNGGIKHHGNLPWYFKLRKSRYHNNYYGTFMILAPGVRKYCHILNLENSTKVNYCGIL
jgi:hypothetical protein